VILSTNKEIQINFSIA